MLLDLLSQIEPDDSWRHQQPDPTPRPYPLAVYVPISQALSYDYDSPAGGGPGPSGILRAGSVRQYLAAAGPVFVPPATVVTPEWMGQSPVPQPPPLPVRPWVVYPLQP